MAKVDGLLCVGGSTKSYDLPCSDKFWQFHRGRYSEVYREHTLVVGCWVIINECTGQTFILSAPLVHRYSILLTLCSLSLSSPFPSVADAVQSELEQYKQSEDEVKRLKDAMVL